MKTVSEKKTKTNLEILNEILSKYKPKTNWLNLGSNVIDNANVGGIKKPAGPKNILQNLSWQIADMKGMNVQNQSSISPFVFYLNLNQNKIFMPQNNFINPTYKISRLKGGLLR